jgi:hypothetical protein
MSEFDYIKAWYQAAKPAWESLCQDPRVTELYRMVADRPDLAQDKALNVASPSSEFDALAASMEVNTLSKVSRAVYYYGHWSPFGHSSPHGATWKLANVLDQHISTRIGARPPHQETGSGISFRVHHGVIRIGVSTRHSWIWEEITYADVDTFKAIQAASRPIMPHVERRIGGKADAEHVYLDRCDKYMQAIKAQYRDTSAVLIAEHSRHALNVGIGPLLDTASFHHDAKDELHLVAVRPDGEKKSKLSGMSSDLAICKRMLADSNIRTIASGKESLPDGTVLIVGTYPEGKSWKGDMSIVYAEVIGESVDTADAIRRSHEYQAQAEIDKAQRTMDTAKEQLVVLRGAR